MFQRLSPDTGCSNAREHDHLPHILLVVDGFPKTLGGGERIVLRLASLLPSYGYRVSILTFAFHPECDFQPASAPCPLYLLPLTRTYNLHAGKAAFALRDFIRSEQVSLVQTFFESSDLWAGMVVRSLTKAKLVWSRRDMGILRGSKHAYAYRLLRHMPHQVVAVSEKVRRHAIDTDKIPEARVKTIHNGLDLEATSCQRQPWKNDEPIRILTIGNIRKVKGHDLLIRVAATVVKQFPTAVFEIAGEVLEEDFYADLVSLVKDLGLQRNVNFLGGIRNIRARLAMADVFVLPSRSEGFSNALLEAMASALPVIATDVGGNGEAVGDEQNGIIVPVEDADALAGALLGILQAPLRALHMGQQGQERVREVFSTEAMMQKTITSFGDLLETRDTPVT